MQINGDLVGLVYCNDANLVMLYEEPGKLDPTAIAGARETSVNGNRAWILDTENALVLIVQHDDLVYAVVGPPDGRLVQAVAAKLPSPPSPSLTDGSATPVVGCSTRSAWADTRSSEPNAEPKREVTGP